MCVFCTWFTDCIGYGAQLPFCINLYEHGGDAVFLWLGMLGSTSFFHPMEGMDCGAAFPIFPVCLGLRHTARLSGAIPLSLCSKAIIKNRSIYVKIVMYF